MFNKKEEQKTVNVSKNESPSLNMLSEGTKFNGTINTQNDIRIAGNTDGELISKGKLIVTSSGVVEGEVNAAEADIAGRVDGEIRVTNKLVLRQSAVVDGDIYTKTLIVEEGAEMNGACRMGSDAITDKKSSISPSTSTLNKNSEKTSSSENNSGNGIKDKSALKT